MLLNAAMELCGVYGFRQFERWNIGFESRPTTTLCISHICGDKLIGFFFNRSWVGELAKETKRERKMKRNGMQ